MFEPVVIQPIACEALKDLAGQAISTRPYRPAYRAGGSGSVALERPIGTTLALPPASCGPQPVSDAGPPRHA